jgi:hypothetical protein
MAISRRINVDSNRTILTVRIFEEVRDPVDDRFEFYFKKDRVLDLCYKY